MAIRTLPIDGVIAANGSLVLTWRPTSGQNWEAQQVTTLAPNVGGSATANLYLDGDFVAIIVPQNGVASGEPFIPILAGHKLTVEYASATPGALVKANLIYDDGTG